MHHIVKSNTEHQRVTGPYFCRQYYVPHAITVRCIDVGSRHVLVQEFLNRHMPSIDMMLSGLGVKNIQFTL